jgi:hypothetical protein
VDVATVQDALEQSYQQNRALLSGLKEADLSRPTTNPHWKVRQLAAHIAEDDGGALYIGKLLARGKNARAPGFVVNLMNWWSVRHYRKAGAQQLVDVLDQKHGRLLDWLAGLPAGALDQGGEISQMGRLTTGEFLIKNAEHSREHAAEVRAALGR